MESSFTEVITPKSTQKQGNLTGMPRKVKDICVSIHNEIQKWNNLILEGIPIVKKIAEIKLTSIDENASSSPAVCPNELILLVDRVKELVSSLGKVQLKFKKYEIQLLNLSKLHPSEPVFNMWDCNRFYESIQKIVEEYNLEIEVKKIVLQDIAHQTGKHDLMYQVASWTHQAYITDQSSMNLRMILIESGLQ